MKCGNCKEEMKLQRTEIIRDKTGKEVGKMLWFVCKNQHVIQVPKKK